MSSVTRHLKRLFLSPSKKPLCGFKSDPLTFCGRSPPPSCLPSDNHRDLGLINSAAVNLDVANRALLVIEQIYYAVVPLLERGKVVDIDHRFKINRSMAEIRSVDPIGANYGFRQ